MGAANTTSGGIGGGLSGALIGAMLGGPVGAVAGGVLGGVGGGILGNQAAQQAKGQQNALNSLLTQQSAQAAQLQQSLLEQPKQVAPDNFLSTKAKSLATLRLGILSTMTGAGGSGGLPGGTLSAPSLSPAGAGKTKLGQ